MRTVDYTQALESLSDSHKEIVRRRYFADLSYAEIAETLSIPVGTVMSRLHYARHDDDRPDQCGGLFSVHRFSGALRPL